MIRSAFRISLVSGLVVLALTAASMLSEPVRPCGGLAKNYAPIVAFELARTQHDLDALFGTGSDACRDTMISQMDRINWIDVLLFIPAYGSFLLFYFLAIRQHAAWPGRCGVALTLSAVIADYLENTCLMHLTPQLDISSPWFALLPWATGMKWLALGLLCAVGFWIYATKRPRNPWLALLCLPGLPVSVAALLLPAKFGAALSGAIGLGWLALLVTAAIGSRRVTG